MRSWVSTKLNCFLAAFSNTICLCRILSRPQPWQTCISLWTPLLQALYGAGILLPLQILARCILQYSRQQLFPQTSVYPTFNQAQRLWPFVLQWAYFRYALAYGYLQKENPGRRQFFLTHSVYRHAFGILWIKTWNVDPFCASAHAVR